MSHSPVQAATAGSETGLVIATYRRHYDVLLADGEVVGCVLKGRSAQIAAGDRVALRRIAGGAAIESISARTNLIYRSDAFKQKLLAANVTQIAGVVAPDIGLDEELINRWMIAAEAAGCRFVLFANKADLPDFPRLLQRLEPVVALGYAVIELAARDDAAGSLPWLAGQHTVLVGQSGMGKSTLINTLIPTAEARTTDISDALLTGRHTTTSTTLYPLPALEGDAWIVDSPGMKAFGLAHLDPETLAQNFVELRPLLGHCRFRNCRHDQEPGCAITEAVDNGSVAPHRVALLHALLHEAITLRDPAR